MRFLETVEVVHQTARIRQLLSATFAHKQLFEWLRSVASAERREIGFCERLERLAKEAVQRMTAVVPVYGLVVQSAFRLGRVTVQPMAGQISLSRDFVVSIKVRLLSLSRRLQNQPEFENLRWRRRKEASLCCDCSIGPLTKVDNVATCVPFGAQHLPSSRVFLLGAGSLPIIHDGYVGAPGHTLGYFTVGSPRVLLSRPGGLCRAAEG